VDNNFEPDFDRDKDIPSFFFDPPKVKTSQRSIFFFNFEN